MAFTQAWLMRFWFRAIGWLWLGMNAAGLVVAFLVAQGTIYLLAYGFSLDLLQNSQDAAFVIGLAVIAFGVTMSLSQWLVLRRRIDAPLLRTVTNVIVGSSTWILLVTRMTRLSNVMASVWLFFVLAVVAGVVVGGVTERVVSLLVRS